LAILFVGQINLRVDVEGQLTVLAQTTALAGRPCGGLRLQGSTTAKGRCKKVIKYICISQVKTTTHSL